MTSRTPARSPVSVSTVAVEPPRAPAPGLTERLTGVVRLMQVLAKLAGAGSPEAARPAMPNPTPELVKARALGG